MIDSFKGEVLGGDTKSGSWLITREYGHTDGYYRFFGGWARWEEASFIALSFIGLLVGTVPISVMTLKNHLSIIEILHPLCTNTAPFVAWAAVIFGGYRLLVTVSKKVVSVARKLEEIESKLKD